MRMRRCEMGRKTKETFVKVNLNLDGSGKVEVNTGIKFLDHMLASFAKHGCLDLKVEAAGDMKHHVAEDVMIVLGKCVERALGNREGIRRIGDAIVPMDDALVLLALDLSGRGYSCVEVKFRGKRLEDMDSELVEHLLHTFAVNGRLNLHVRVLSGRNDHHKAEAIFKALGLAFQQAVHKWGIKGVPSTKGVV